MDNEVRPVPPRRKKRTGVSSSQLSEEGATPSLNNTSHTTAHSSNEAGEHKHGQAQTHVPPRPPKPKQRPRGPAVEASLSCGAESKPLRPPPPSRQLQTEYVKLQASNTAGNDSFVTVIDSKVSREHYALSPKAAKECVQRQRSTSVKDTRKSNSSSSQVCSRKNATLPPNLSSPTPSHKDSQISNFPLRRTSETKSTSPKTVPPINSVSSGKQKPEVMKSIKKKNSQQKKSSGNKSSPFQKQPHPKPATARATRNIQQSPKAVTLPRSVLPVAVTTDTPSAVQPGSGQEQTPMDDDLYAYVDLSKPRYVHRPRQQVDKSDESDDGEMVSKGAGDDHTFKLETGAASNQGAYTTLQNRPPVESSVYALPNAEPQNSRNDSKPSSNPSMYASLQTWLLTDSAVYAVPFAESSDVYTALTSITTDEDKSVYTVPHTKSTSQNAERSKEVYAQLTSSRNDSSVYQAPGADGQWS